MNSSVQSPKVRKSDTPENPKVFENSRARESICLKDQTLKNLEVRHSLKSEMHDSALCHYNHYLHLPFTLRVLCAGMRSRNGALSIADWKLAVRLELHWSYS